MTTSEALRRPPHAYVWIWLPGADDPVVAGRLTDRGAEVTFTYGQSYLARPNAIALSLPELPLRRGELSPLSGDIAGCIADAGPDAWGRRVIEHRRLIEPGGLSTLGYLLESGSDRIGALDIQPAADAYVPRLGGVASLEQLAEATRRVEEGLPLSNELGRALVHGSSAGGARPKVLITAGESRTSPSSPLSATPTLSPKPSTSPWIWHGWRASMWHRWQSLGSPAGRYSSSNASTAPRRGTGG